jgi:uncharacterized protein YdiU (UPF0061 family)
VLADHVIAHLYPAAAAADRPYLALLSAVIDRQAELVARWQLVGFIHGVMNTDNMSIAGETIDYGPCAFMDSYHPDMVYSSIDHGGRYAYGNQPSIAHWNLASFAQALLPLMGDEEAAAVALANEMIQTFPERFEGFYRAGLRRKLGLAEVREDDVALAQDLLARMADNRADFTLTFRRLCDVIDEGSGTNERMSGLFEDPAAFDDWAVRWRKRLASERRSHAECRSDMRSVNPAFQPGQERYAAPPRPDQIVHQTFCGT